MIPHYSYVCLDLDGTITESAEGILNSFAHAIRVLGLERDRASLAEFIGPPLLDSFLLLTGDEERARQGVGLYREYYAEHGIFECRVYDGVREMLEGLRAAGCRTALATSKPEPFARRILDHFGLTPLLTAVSGADLAGKLQKKEDVLRNALDRLGSDGSSTLMVGDRIYDVEGAARLGIPCAAVLYGYGPAEELAGAAYLCRTPADVLAAALTGSLPA